MRVLYLAASILAVVSTPCMSEEWVVRGHALPPEQTAVLNVPANVAPIHHPDHNADLPINPEPSDARTATRPPTMLHIGPVQAETIDGHTRFRLEGVAVLGGSVSGTVSGRGAKVYLRWPNNDQ